MLLSSLKRKLHRLRLRLTIGPRHPTRDQLVANIAVAAALEDSSAESVALKDFVSYCHKNYTKAHSQLFQDLFALYVLGEKRDGYYCEFGATNGVTLSNSCLLDKGYGWKGICAEPARGWHKELKKNRPSAHIETACVWKNSDEQLQFSEADMKEVSTIVTFVDSDGHAELRQSSHSYTVPTISLNELLDKYAAPKDFDFLSIDTEGSEYEILSAFDFSRHSPKLIVLEHNYRPDRQNLFELLSDKGYRRVFDKLSLFDDWYIRNDIPLPANASNAT